MNFKHHAGSASVAQGVVTSLWATWVTLCPPRLLRKRFRSFIVRTIVRVLTRSCCDAEGLNSDLKALAGACRRAGCLGARNHYPTGLHRWIPEAMIRVGCRRWGDVTKTLTQVSFIGRSLPPGGRKKIESSLVAHHRLLSQLDPLSADEASVAESRPVLCERFRELSGQWARAHRPNVPDVEQMFTSGASCRNPRRLGGHGGERDFQSGNPLAGPDHFRLCRKRAFIEGSRSEHAPTLSWVEVARQDVTDYESGESIFAPESGAVLDLARLMDSRPEFALFEVPPVGCEAFASKPGARHVVLPPSQDEVEYLCGFTSAARSVRLLAEGHRLGWMPVTKVTACPERGNKARVVTSAPVSLHDGGQVLRKMCFSALRKDPRISKVLSGDKDEAIRFAMTRVDPTGKLVISTDLSAATDTVYQDVAQAVWLGLADGWGLTPDARDAGLFLLGRHLVFRETEIPFFGLDELKEGDPLVHEYPDLIRDYASPDEAQDQLRGSPDDRSAVYNCTRGILMGNPLSWTILSIIQICAAGCANSMLPLDTTGGQLTPYELKNSFSVCGDDLAALWPKLLAEAYHWTMECCGFRFSPKADFIHPTRGVFAERCFILHLVKAKAPIRIRLLRWSVGNPGETWAQKVAWERNIHVPRPSRNSQTRELIASSPCWRCGVEGWAQKCSNCQALSKIGLWVRKPMIREGVRGSVTVEFPGFIPLKGLVPSQWRDPQDPPQWLTIGTSSAELVRHGGLKNVVSDVLRVLWRTEFSSWVSAGIPTSAPRLFGGLEAWWRPGPKRALRLSRRLARKIAFRSDVLESFLSEWSMSNLGNPRANRLDSYCRQEVQALVRSATLVRAGDSGDIPLKEVLLHESLLLKKSLLRSGLWRRMIPPRSRAHHGSKNRTSSTVPKLLSLGASSRRKPQKKVRVESLDQNPFRRIPAHLAPRVWAKKVAAAAGKLPRRGADFAKAQAFLAKPENQVVAILAVPVVEVTLGNGLQKESRLVPAARSASALYKKAAKPLVRSLLFAKQERERGPRPWKRQSSTRPLKPFRVRMAGRNLTYYI